MLGLVETQGGCFQLRGHACQQGEIGLLVLGKLPHVTTLEGGQFSVLVVEFGFGILQLLGQELRRFLCVLLVQAQILRHEHRGNFSADLLGKPSLSHGDVHVESGQLCRPCTRHRAQRGHLDGLPQLLNQVLHRHWLDVCLVHEPLD